MCQTRVTESEIQESLELLTQGRTVLAIAHRLTTIHHADNIVVMGEGGILQQGRHENLIKVPGHYKDLYEASNKRLDA